jgi:hypothetical protein
MDPNILKTVIAQIHRRYPEFAGSQPKVRQQDAKDPHNIQLPKSLFTAPTYLLTFYSTGRAQSASGSKSIPRWVRVVINERGRILKITTSH